MTKYDNLRYIAIAPCTCRPAILESIEDWIAIQYYYNHIAGYIANGEVNVGLKD